MIKAPPTTFWRRFRFIGPSLILTATLIGSGELIVTTTYGAQAGFKALWLIVAACFLKVAIQEALGRYTISSGDTSLVALNRLPRSPLGRWLGGLDLVHLRDLGCRSTGRNCLDRGGMSAADLGWCFRPLVGPLRVCCLLGHSLHRPLSGGGKNIRGAGQPLFDFHHRVGDQCSMDTIHDFLVTDPGRILLSTAACRGFCRGRQCAGSHRRRGPQRDRDYVLSLLVP